MTKRTTTRTVPYNTGKVQIGIHYVPKPELPTDSPSADMARLQTALINNPATTSAETWMFRGVVVFCTAIIFADLFIWRP